MTREVSLLRDRGGPKQLQWDFFRSVSLMDEATGDTREEVKLGADASELFRKIQDAYERGEEVRLDVDQKTGKVLGWAET